MALVQVVARENGRRPSAPLYPPPLLRPPALIENIETGLMYHEDGRPFLAKDENGDLRHVGLLNVTVGKPPSGKVWQLVTGTSQATQKAVQALMELWDMQIKADGDTPQEIAAADPSDP